MALKPAMMLADLPSDIILSVADFLDDASAVCLKNTNSAFRGLIQRDANSFNPCSKWLIMCRFEADLIANLPLDRLPDKLVCAFCKAKQARDQFEPIYSPGWKGVGLPVSNTASVIETPNTTRYCARHPIRISWVRPSSKQDKKRRWIMCWRLTCMHCKVAVHPSDGRHTGCDQCHCDICPRLNQELLTRYGPLPWPARSGRPYIGGISWLDDGTPKILEFGSKYITEHCRNISFNADL